MVAAVTHHSAEAVQRAVSEALRPGVFSLALTCLSHSQGSARLAKAQAPQLQE